jgi:hypothetical protein
MKFGLASLFPLLIYSNRGKSVNTLITTFGLNMGSSYHLHRDSIYSYLHRRSVPRCPMTNAVQLWHSTEWTPCEDNSTQNRCTYGLCPSSKIKNIKKHNVSETGSVFVFSWGEGDTCSVGSLRKSYPQSLDNGRCSQTQWLRVLYTIVRTFQILKVIVAHLVKKLPFSLLQPNVHYLVRKSSHWSLSWAR